MPAGIAPWVDALKAVDSRGCSISSQDVWPYWFPEPGQVIGSTNIARRKRTFRNWLLIRPAWLAGHRTGDRSRSERARTAKEWGMFLGYTPEIHAMVQSAQATPAGAAKKTIVYARTMAKFQSLVDVGSLFMDQALSWYGRPLAETPELVPARQVTWELHELSFRAELMALDRFLVDVPPGDHWMRQRRDERILTIFRTRELYAALYIPSTPVGLASPDATGRAESLEALRWLMLSWPKTPDVLKGDPLRADTPADMIEKVEKEIAIFYCSTFYRVSGRAPVLPRVPPPRSQ